MSTLSDKSSKSPEPLLDGAADGDAVGDVGALVGTVGAVVGGGEVGVGVGLGDAEVGETGAVVGASAIVVGAHVGSSTCVRNSACWIVLGTGPVKMWQAPVDGRKENSTQRSASAAIHASAQLLDESTVIRLIL